MLIQFWRRTILEALAEFEKNSSIGIASGGYIRNDGKLSEVTNKNLLVEQEGSGGKYASLRLAATRWNHLQIRFPI